MALFDSDPVEREAVRLGRVHEVPAEIHYSERLRPLVVSRSALGPGDPPVHEWEFSPALRDPRNRFVLRLIKKGWTDERIAAELVSEVQRTEPLTPEEERGALRSATVVVREVRRASGRAHEPHVLRVYGLKNASKSDERILVTIDQDLVHEAPMVPFTRTEKGSRRLQIAMMAAMAIIDAIFLYAMVSFVNAGPSFAVNAGQVQQLSLSFGQLIALPSVILVTYVLMATENARPRPRDPARRRRPRGHPQRGRLPGQLREDARVDVSLADVPARPGRCPEPDRGGRAVPVGHDREPAGAVPVAADRARLGEGARGRGVEPVDGPQGARPESPPVDPPRSPRDVGPRRDRRHGGRRGGLGGDGGGGVTDASGNLRRGRPRGGPGPPLARLPAPGDGSRGRLLRLPGRVPTGSTPARLPRNPRPSRSRSSSSPSRSVPWRTGP